MSKKFLFLIFMFIISLFVGVGISIFILRDPISQTLSQTFSIFLPKKSTENPTVNNVTINEDNFVVEVIEQYGDAVVSINYIDDVFSEYSEAIGSGVVVTSEDIS